MDPTSRSQAAAGLRWSHLEEHVVRFLRTKGGYGPNRRKGGDMALTDANPAFGPAERKGGGSGSFGAPRGLQTAGSMLRDVGRLLRIFGKIATGFWVFGFEIWVFGTKCWVFGTVCWVFGTGSWVFGTRSWVFGSAVGEIPTWIHLV